jgi:dTMP kinase
MAGKFITFEGGDGAGKSTQIKRLATALEAAGRTVTTTREPGGTPTAESVRQFLLSGKAEQLGADGEAILFAAARADHVENVIRPALERGNWVLCDRFSDSTRVYQGATGGVDNVLLDALERIAIGESRPDLTVILDIPVSIGRTRIHGRMGAGGDTKPDRFEGEDLELQERRRQAFLEIAANEPDRCVVVDATRSEDEVAEEIWAVVSARLLGEAAA